MTELTAIGTSRFLPGFALAGVRTVLANEEDAADEIAKCDGVVVIEGELFDKLPEEQRTELQAGTEPVVLPLSEDEGNETERLRRLIRSTLGVDLLK